MHDVQHALVNAQTNTVIEASTQCRHCHAELSIKTMHAIQYKTVYGKVTIDSPLSLAIPFRMSPELEYLQVKWAAHLPYGAVTKLLKKILPLDQAISTAGVQNRLRAVRQELDDQVKSAVRGERTYRSIRVKKLKITRLLSTLRGCGNVLRANSKTKPSSRHISLRSDSRQLDDT